MCSFVSKVISHIVPVKIRTFLKSIIYGRNIKKCYNKVTKKKQKEARINVVFLVQ